MKRIAVVGSIAFALLVRAATHSETVLDVSYPVPAFASCDNVVDEFANARLSGTLANVCLNSLAAGKSSAEQAKPTMAAVAFPVAAAPGSNSSTGVVGATAI